MKKFGIVVTTINVPSLLLGYADNFDRYGHRSQVEFIVIGDRKTPEEARDVTDVLNRRGFLAEYWDVDAQQDWLRAYPDLDALIPYNSDNRRNIGYLIAAQHECDIIITIDDDNYIYREDSDFLTGHSVVGETIDVTTVHISTGWFNICSMLEMDPAITVYPRGYPYGKRWNDGDVLKSRELVTVMINAGLWLGAPDVDAVTRLTLPVRAIALTEERVALGRNVWSPINSQNTAFHRSILPICYYVLMGSEIQGLEIDRYGDIWFGYFAQKVLHHLGLAITFGVPLVVHRRNFHNLFVDLRQEYWGMVATDLLVSLLEDIQLTSDTVESAYLELANALRQQLDAADELHPAMRRHLIRVCDGMEIWVDVCNQMLVS